MSYINKKFILIFILIILIFISSQLNDYNKRKYADDLSIQNNIIIYQNESNEKINLTITDNSIWRIFNSIFNVNTDQFEYVNSKMPELSESKNFATDFNLFKKEFNQRFRYIYK